MADETKQTLLEVKLNLSDAIQEMAVYQQKIDDISIEMQKLTAAYKNGETSREQYNQDMIRLKETQKAYKKEMGELSRVTQNQIIAQQKYEGTIKGMCAELSVAKDKLRAMKVTDPGWEEQRDYVDKLNAKIKELEQSYGVYQRDVGHYRTEQEKTKEQIAETVRQMQELIAAHREDSPEMEKCTQDLENYNNALQNSTKNGLDSMTQASMGLIGAMTILGNTFGDDSEESKKMQELVKKLSIAITALTVATKIYQAAQKSGLITRIAMNLQIKTATAALTKEATAEAGATGATIAHKVAQDALNTSMLANPIMLIVAAVVALVAGLVALVAWLVRSTDAQKAANAAMKEYEKQSAASQDAIAHLDAAEKARAITLQQNYQREMADMMKNGATQEQIDKKKAEMEEALLQLTIESSRKKMEEQKKEMAAAEANYKAQVRLMNELIRTKGADAKKTKEQIKAAQEAHQAYLQILNAYNDSVKAISDAEFQIVSNSYSRRSSAADKAYDRAVKQIDNLDKRYQEAYKRRYMFQYDYTKSAEENDAEKWRLAMSLENALFLHQQKVAKDKLELDKKYGKITEEQYKEQMKILASELYTFQLQQAEDIAEHQRQLVENAIKLAGGAMLETRLQEVRDTYAAALRAIQEDTNLSDEEKAYYAVELAQKQAEAEKKIRLDNEKQIADNIKKSIDELYKYDIRQFSAEETEKLAMEIEQQKALIAERKKAGLNTLADEAKLAQLEANMRAAQLNKDYQLAWKNQDKQFKLQKKYLEDEIALYEEGTSQRAALEQELAELVVQYNQQKLESAQDYANQTMEIFSGVHDLMSQLEERSVSEAESAANDRKKALDKQLKAGLISQKQYDKQVADLDADLDKKKAEIARKQAIREKALSALQIGINTAAAIMKIWAEVPKMDFGVSTAVLTALAAATGAVQLAAVLATPIPTARIGGLVQGGTHEQGGVLVNTEGGERIISRDASAAFPELLNLISYIGKHSSVPDTGYAAALLGERSTERNVDGTPIDYDILAQKIGEQVSAALQQNPPRIAVDQYEDARSQYTKIEDSAKI